MPLHIFLSSRCGTNRTHTRTARDMTWITTWSKPDVIRSALIHQTKNQIRFCSSPSPRRRSRDSDSSVELMMEDDELSTGKEGVKEFTQAVTVMDNWHQRWLTGVELLQDINENKHLLPTGFEGLDRLLGGGLRQGQLTEIAGPSSSGKTQVCLYSASHIADKHLGVVMFLDTCNSFSPNRIACIVNQLPTSLVKDVNIGGGKICLLIIDSISSLIGPTLGGKSSEGTCSS
ncbi:DNA repair protein RAD51 homolog 4 isoform X6 [Typha latifolia]|uniref:DNA repair protein RAD51 homolog 4 isoform X6 n=1 Tax=Typha latifolia TaxID=4733 RepID=UPI003C306A68